MCRSALCQKVFALLQKPGDGTIESVAPSAGSDEAFETPLTIEALAASLRHSQHLFVTPFGDNFMQVSWNGNQWKSKVKRGTCNPIWSVILAETMNAVTISSLLLM